MLIYGDAATSELSSTSDFITFASPNRITMVDNTEQLVAVDPTDSSEKNITAIALKSNECDANNNNMIVHWHPWRTSEVGACECVHECIAIVF